MRTKSILLGAAVLLTQSSAGTPAVANGPPINTKTAFVAGLSGAAFRSFARTLRKSDAGRDLRVIAVPLVFPYELLPNRLVVGGAIPYLDKELEIKAGGTRQTIGDSGFGDLTLFGKYQILQRDRPGETTRLTFLGRLKLPTGEDDGEAPGGTALPRPLQLGTGSVDFAGGAVITALKQRWGINADVVYTTNGSDDGFQFGDILKYDVALAYRAYPGTYATYPSPQLNFFLEINGETRNRDTLDGGSLSDTGGTSILISPGIQYIAGRTFLVESSIQIPIVENLNGNQMETDYAFSLGLRWLIF